MNGKNFVGQSLGQIIDQLLSRDIYDFVLTNYNNKLQYSDTVNELFHTWEFSFGSCIKYIEEFYNGD